MSTLKVNKLLKVSGNSKFILQSKRFQAPELQTTVTQFSWDADDLAPTTGNTESKWTASFTPVSTIDAVEGVFLPAGSYLEGPVGKVKVASGGFLVYILNTNL